MKVVILVALVAVAMAAPQNVEVLRSESEIVAPESFSYNLELSDQTKLKQSGKIVNPQEPDQEQRNLAVEGEYSFVSKEGDKVRVTYTADNTGYKPLVYINDVLQNPEQ